MTGLWRMQQIDHSCSLMQKTHAQNGISALLTEAAGTLPASTQPDDRDTWCHALKKHDCIACDATD